MPWAGIDGERTGQQIDAVANASEANARGLNLNPDANSARNLGIVVLGSVYPTRSDAKLTFPLYLGGGYLLNGGKLFFLLGPGIGIRL